MSAKTGDTGPARRRVILAWVLVGLIAASLAMAIPVFVSTVNADEPGPNVIGFNCDYDVNPATAVADGEACALDIGLTGALADLILVVGLAALGVLAVRRQPENPTGLLLILIALVEPWIAITVYAADWVFIRHEAPQWVGTTALIVGSPRLAGSFLCIAVFLLLFPTGRFVNKWWRGLAVMAGVAALMVWAQVFHPEYFSSDLSDIKFYYTPGAANPIAARFIPVDVFDVVFEWGIGFLLVSIIAAVLSLVHRFWRASGDERQQLKAVALGVGSYAVFAVVFANLNPLGGFFSWMWENSLLFLILFVFPAFAVALLKYRLYDIDVVINKALVYGSLVALIAVVLSAIAFVPFVVIGTPETGATGRLVLPFVATLVVVVLIQPARDRLQKLANRVVYGRRATPYEALIAFSASVADSSADEELLGRMAAILAQGTGADSSRVWLVGDGVLRSASSYPPSSTLEELTLDGRDLPEIHGATTVVPVMHKGELLGALSIAKAPGDPLRPIEGRLVEDLASQAGVVLRNFRLTEELLERLDQLRSSRQRLVAAQDDERRRLERNLHDGAQQQLVALKIKLGLLRGIDEPERRNQLLAGLMTEADDAIQGLRDLARGIYPPMLAEEGLVKALRSQAAKAVIPVEVESVRVGRYPQEVEAAVYFCALEALQNVTKYAGADKASVILEGGNGSLEFEITDNGTGFDLSTAKRGAGLQNMEDRIEALGGTITITSAIGEGTVVSGVVPTSVA